MDMATVRRACLVGTVFLVVQTGAATPVEVDNPSFEAFQLPSGGHYWSAPSYWNGGATSYDPVPEWTVAGGAGTWYPTPESRYPSRDGRNIAWVHSGSLSQHLSISLATGMHYELAVDVGAPLGLGSPGYLVELLAGDIVLASNNSVVIPLDGLATVSVVFDTPDGHPGIGQPLGIRLRSYGEETDFDSVRLDATPEPASLALLALGGMAMLRRRRK